MSLVKIAFLVFAVGIVGCSAGGGSSTPSGYINPDPPKPKPREDEANTVVYDPRVDILFVVDNSGSMSNHQQQLANNIDQFLRTFFQNNVLEYQIGVITTDSPNLVGYPMFIDKSTPNPEVYLSRSLKVGTTGSPIEAVFDPTIGALTPPVSDQYNQGFFRDGAYLAVIFITDAEDQSRQFRNPKVFYKTLVDLKHGDREKVLLYGVIVPTNTIYPTCARDGQETPVSIETALQMSVTAPDNVMEICSPDYGVKLAALSQKLISQIAREVKLAQVPSVDSIEVIFGTQVIPEGDLEGWSYDSTRNAVILGPNIKWVPQPKGTRLKVKYIPLNY